MVQGGSRYLFYLLGLNIINIKHSARMRHMASYSEVIRYIYLSAWADVPVNAGSLSG